MSGWWPRACKSLTLGRAQCNRTLWFPTLYDSPRAGTWGSKNVIVYTPDPGGPIWRVPSGAPIPLFQIRGRAPISSTDLFTYDATKDGKRIHPDPPYPSGR
jgi:hypothetical protein